MADALGQELGIKPELIKGGGGDFIVVADGKEVFSKKEVGRFPEHDEIIESLKAQGAA